MVAESHPADTLSQLRIRRSIVVRGVVQGVGFRPFVYRAARRHGLGGWVRNTSDGVEIEVEGPATAVALFEAALRNEAPPLSAIDSIAVVDLPLDGHGSEGRAAQPFEIRQSVQLPGTLQPVSADLATCGDCLHELFDPEDRRYRYPFINCTNCGPRFTIIEDMPYDRSMTTMKRFVMCPQCWSEYVDPDDRRFHAQPNACPSCGPRVLVGPLSPSSFSLERRKGDSASSLDEAAHLLARGGILAVKGLGGYHLACDALNPDAVARLRQRKHREDKPFALMVPDLGTAKVLCDIAEAEAELLCSRQRPIVLLGRREDCPVAPGVAPGTATLGIMLPYTPLHHLLLKACTSRLSVLVMTSGNVSDEPIAYRDDDALGRLGPIADAFLIHNREIHMRCDDSVVRIVATGKPEGDFVGRQLLRRSRGYVPEPITLTHEFPLPVLAYGGHLKNTFCLGKGRLAFVSHHIGDLENLEALTSFRQGIEHFARLFDIQPEAVAYDLHPEYLATKEALASEVPIKVGVQHHHAHIASVLAEHGLEGPVIGIAADGTGYGTDGTVWGGEVLVASLTDFQRVAHLAYVPLPGGEQAIRQPWRMGAMYLEQVYGPSWVDMQLPFAQRVDRRAWQMIRRMVERGINSPPTSSLGRLFDAVAALLGLRWEVNYEGQAAVELESLAQNTQAFGGVPGSAGPRPYPFCVSSDEPAELRVEGVIGGIVEDLRRGAAEADIAMRFHHSVAQLLVVACQRVRDNMGLTEVALSGGVFQNELLLELTGRRLEELGFIVYRNRQVPPNDGGLSLGQAAVAAARLRERKRAYVSGNSRTDR